MKPFVPSRKLAKDMDTQCFGKKFYAVGKGTWRCQLEEGHPGKHIDSAGREWNQRQRGGDKP